MIIPDTPGMFCFFLSGLFLLKGLIGLTDISIAIAASILQCISCSLWNIFNAVRGTKEHCGWTVCCRGLSLQFISTCKFFKSNTFQSLWNEEILMCESPLSSSLTRNTKCKPRKIMSILTLDARGKTWLRERGNRISFSQGYLYCLGKVSNNPLYLLILGIYLKIFHCYFIHNCLTFA